MQDFIFKPLMKLWKALAALLFANLVLMELEIWSLFFVLPFEPQAVYLTMFGLWILYAIELGSRCLLSKWLIGKTVYVTVERGVLKINGLLMRRRSYSLADDLTFRSQRLQASEDPVFQYSSRIELIVGQKHPVPIVEVVDPLVAENITRNLNTALLLAGGNLAANSLDLDPTRLEENSLLNT